MKLSTFFIASALVFSGAFARPSRLAERMARREAARSGNPLQLSRSNEELKAALGNTTHPTEFSTNWSGAVIESPPAGQTFTTVVGTFVIPTPSGNGAASAWVGIDGDTASNSILQSGVDFNVNNGRVSYDSWFEWFPNFAIDIPSFVPSAGNTVRITVHSTSTTTGTVTLENLTTGQRVTENVSAPSRSAALAGQNAEWIVEDFEENGGLVPLTNWGTVTFTGAQASTASSSLTPAGATIINMEQNNRVLTSVSVSGSTVTVRHT
ncbi:hypothetical protein K435DRAFT_853933 [Dendrothele bispora CBS 962.96]|uniref:Aspergillopepsin n=1 Tax=Dendrothele bispora (strain CBS 962.96) TaxID=1314807 RepID=A0A4S8MGA3_DENBC|nr:hypothetical protein K435DRAFT_853933 [Dendrothele bispora CBS 962.96]